MVLIFHLSKNCRSYLDSVLFFPLLSAFFLLFLFLASLVLFRFRSCFLLLVLSLPTYGCTAFIPKIKQEKKTK